LMPEFLHCKCRSSGSMHDLGMRASMLPSRCLVHVTYQWAISLIELDSAKVHCRIEQPSVALFGSWDPWWTTKFVSLFVFGSA
jgi:hypothetical protein